MVQCVLHTTKMQKATARLKCVCVLKNRTFSQKKLGAILYRAHIICVLLYSARIVPVTCWLIEIMTQSESRTLSLIYRLIAGLGNRIALRKTHLSITVYLSHHLNYHSIIWSGVKIWFCSRIWNFGLLQCQIELRLLVISITAPPGRAHLDQPLRCPVKTCLQSFSQLLRPYWHMRLWKLLSAKCSVSFILV